MSEETKEDREDRALQELEKLGFKRYRIANKKNQDTDQHEPRGKT